MATMYAVKASDLTAIADAIRLKTGDSAEITVDEMPTQIGLIDSGGTDWQSIGYASEPQYITDGVAYAQTIKNNWNPSTTSMLRTFQGNKDIVYMPLVDTSRVTDMWYAFYNASYLQKIPALDLSKVTRFQEVFYGCSGLLEIAPLNLSSATGMLAAFSGCSRIKSLELTVSDKLTNMQQAFENCGGLTSITLTSSDTSKVTNMYKAFMGCGSLTSIPSMNTEKVTSMAQAFQGCGSLTKVTSDELSDTSKVQGFLQAFYVCQKLKTVELNCSSAISIPSMFGTCSALESVVLTNLGAGYLTTASANYGNYTLNLSSTNKLTESAVIALFNSIADIGARGVATQKIILSSTVYNSLSAETIAIATNKGWTVGTS